MTVAAIQLAAELGNVSTNLQKALDLVHKAANARPTLIVLPEFFTSAMALSPVMEEVALKNREHKVPQRLFEAAQRFHSAIAGSYLNIVKGQVYNTMLLQFPDGRRFFHNKDLPTQFENRYYTAGDSLRALDGIGVALCWEMLRTQTVAQMPPDLQIVAAGSCWWDVAGDRSTVLRDYNHVLNQETPQRFAALLGAPVVHAAHVGKVTGSRNSTDSSLVERQLIGTTQIVNSSGKTQCQLSVADGDGVLVDNVELPRRRKPRHLANGFWITSLHREYLMAWDRENSLGQDFYAANRLRMIEKVAT